MSSKNVFIYDFDGVICDSVNVKTDAFAEMYTEFGDVIVQKVIDYHLLHGGISRFEKFKFYHKHFLGIELDEYQLKLMGKQFAELAKEKVIKSNFIVGADLFLKNNSKKRLQFICTGTPETEILEITDKKGIATYFKGIFGSPDSKSSIIKKIIRDFNLHVEEVLFFGDAITDYNSAKECGIDFVGIRSDHTSFPEGTFIVSNFESKELSEFLKGK